ncbi:hypothetical protein F0562_018471 [Nyssa sinensis]|uniref:NAC domain-containing protein n=1 Tax=Nyssa sinensis TaxID=561372 RepID=A0A5J4ZBP8_9ASTE|nr:hypothetical protein F0562_018471 [Nyssa sinensis]
MHDYRLVNNNSGSKPPGADIGSKKGSLRLDDWVLCRIYKKNNSSRSMDDSMENMIASLPSSSMDVSESQKLVASKTTDNYAALLRIDENMFDGILCGDAMQSSSLSQLGSSSSKTDVSMVSNPLKRTHPSDHDQYWINETNGTDGNGSFVTLLNQFPQNLSFNPNTVLGSLGDSIMRQPFQLSHINWKS